MAEFYGVQKESAPETPTMLRVIRICQKCGARILSDAPEGLCARCVLKTALGNFPHVPVAGIDNPGHAYQPSPDETNAAAYDKKATGAAELLGELGDYELLEELGR